MSKIKKSLFVFAMLFWFLISAYAQEEDASQISVDAAVHEKIVSKQFLVETEADVTEQVLEEEFPHYMDSLQKLIKNAEENIRKVDNELEKVEIKKRNQEREKNIREHVEKGDEFYAKGMLGEAKTEWKKVLELSKSPEMRDYIKEGIEKVKAEEKRIKEEEREKSHR